LLAETALRQEETNPNFSISLLQITASDSYPYNTRLASALFFKNFIKRSWTDEDGNYKLPLEVVAAIKQDLINLMISVPQGIQIQLGDAVSIIADSDFWERWDTLVNVSSIFDYLILAFVLLCLIFALGSCIEIPTG
jgi:exportin-2 (importin alpha re-exporter)